MLFRPDTLVSSATVWSLMPPHCGNIGPWWPSPLPGAVEVVAPGLLDTAGGSDGQEGFVYQAYQPLPVFDGNHAVVGSWVIEGKAAGVGMREDERRITHNNSRFVPHYFR